jgi:hypothetical protein
MKLAAPLPKPFERDAIVQLVASLRTPADKREF